MQQQHLFSHDAFDNMVPYLDPVSRTRLPQTSRAFVGNHSLCVPEVNVFRAHRINGSCPPYAQTFNANTNCCETSIQNAQPNANANLTPDQVSDMEFLLALKHGYQFPPQTAQPNPHRTVRIILRQIVPDLIPWFHRRRNSVPAPALIPGAVGVNQFPPLVLNSSRVWFDLVVKFYIRLRPPFTIQATDHAGLFPSVVFSNFTVMLSSGPYRDRLIALIQEVGAIAVSESENIPIFTPYPLKCRTYNCLTRSVDITNLPAVIADPRCGLRGEHSMKFDARAMVRAGTPWVTTFVNIFLSMWHRQGLQYFYVRVWNRNPQLNPPLPPAAIPIPAAVTILPPALTIADAIAQYRQVAENLVASLPAGDDWQLSQDTLDDVPASWGVLWKVHSDSHDDRFELSVTHRGMVSMKLRRV